MNSGRPARGDVWLIDLNPTRGHEQAGTRPCVVLSTDIFNHGPAGLHVIVPMTSRDRGIRWHVPVHPPEGGLRRPSYIKCEDIRSVTFERFSARWGILSSQTMVEVERRMRILLEL